MDLTASGHLYTSRSLLVHKFYGLWLHKLYIFLETSAYHVHAMALPPFCDWFHGLELCNFILNGSVAFMVIHILEAVTQIVATEYTPDILQLSDSFNRSEEEEKPREWSGILVLSALPASR